MFRSTGLDDIPATFLRDAKDIVAPTITVIVNLSLEKGMASSDMKLARIIPFFKKGNRYDPGNDYPISILSVASKNLEKIVHKQIQEMYARVI